MAKFIKTQGNFRVYELDEKECKQHSRVYPTFVCWDKDNIGNMNLTENETETLDEMIKWCKEYTY